MASRLSILWLACLFLVASCRSKPDPGKITIPVDDADSGSVSGTVTFLDAKPKEQPIDMSATPACAPKGSVPRYAEDVVVNPDGKMKYVFVRVKSGLPNRQWPPPAEPAALDQTGCMYTPHVIGAMVNQDIKFSNSDSVNHNIHPLPRVNEEWNATEPPKTSDVVRRFTREEVPVLIKCNLHPWMRAYIGVVSHPFFAVTDDSGAFHIKGLPAGKYTLEAWHERYGIQDVEIRIDPKRDTAVSFAFRSHP